MPSCCTRERGPRQALSWQDSPRILARPAPPKSMPQAPRFLPASGYDSVNAKKRVRPVVKALNGAYPRARTSLNHENAFQLLISTILSAQSTDETVNKVTPALFARYPTPQALASARSDDLEKIVYPTGFF